MVRGCASIEELSLGQCIGLTNISVQVHHLATHPAARRPPPRMAHMSHSVFNMGCGE